MIHVVNVIVPISEARLKFDCFIRPRKYTYVNLQIEYVERMMQFS